MLIEQVELLILLKIDSILWLKTARYRRFVVMLCYRPIQRLSDNRSINLNLLDYMYFLQEIMMLPFAKLGRIEHISFVNTLNTNYRDTWRQQWSTPGHLWFLPRYLSLMELQEFSMKTNSFLRANDPYLELCKGLQKILGLTNNHYRKYWSQKYLREAKNVWEQQQNEY